MYMHISVISRAVGVVDVIDNFELADSNCSIVRMLHGSLFFVYRFVSRPNRYHFIMFV